jgi:hypothetical protein
MNMAGNGVPDMGYDQEKSSGRTSSKLVDAVRQVKIAAADKSDVVVEMREADRTRLELLAQDLDAVIKDVPIEDDRFDFAISTGLQPRFWIDATAHVMMGPDRRTYRFVRDTRLGRILLAESADRTEIAEKVTSYIATRMHERELAFAGDLVSYRELATARAIGLDADEDKSDAAEAMRAADGAHQRIERAALELKNGNAEAGRGETVTITSRAAEGSADEETSPAHQSASRSKAALGGIFWILLGVAAGGGGLLWLFREQLL